MFISGWGLCSRRKILGGWAEVAWRGQRLLGAGGGWGRAGAVGKVEGGCKRQRGEGLGGGGGGGGVLGGGGSDVALVLGSVGGEVLGWGRNLRRNPPFL